MVLNFSLTLLERVLKTHTFLGLVLDGKVALGSKYIYSPKVDYKFPKW